ncbi:MAG: hypothetical protein WCX12_02560 [Candidatus Paceibacterota bacterium]|jgi:DNA polymerase III delta subunit
MIIFLYGPDDYRREEKRRAIVGEFLKKRSGLSVRFFSAEGDLNWFEEFKSFLRNQSIFESAKLVVIGGILEVPAKGLAEELKLFLENKSVTVVISTPDKPGKELNFLLKKPVLTQGFDVLKGKEWNLFVKREIKKREMNFAPAAVDFLEKVYEGNPWRLVTELDKLRCLELEIIDRKDLEKMGLEVMPNFWSLILGFKSRFLGDRLRALEKMLGTNEPTAKVFNIIAYQLPEKIEKIAGYDLAIKSGKMDYEEALVDLALS